MLKRLPPTDSDRLYNNVAMSIPELFRTHERMVSAERQLVLPGLPDDGWGPNEEAAHRAGLDELDRERTVVMEIYFEEQDAALRRCLERLRIAGLDDWIKALGTGDFHDLAM